MAGLSIIIDSREQLPLQFTHKSITATKVQKLDVGDYAAEFDDGYRPPVVFERKSLGDLYGTLSAGYDRFKNEIERAKVSETKIIIITEGTLTKTLFGNIHSSRTPQSIVYQLFTIRIRYGIETVFCSSREEIAEYISQFYIAHKKERDLR